MQYLHAWEECDVFQNTGKMPFPEWLKEHCIDEGEAEVDFDNGDAGGKLLSVVDCYGDDVEVGDDDLVVINWEDAGEIYVYSPEEFKEEFVVIPENAKERLEVEYAETSARYDKLLAALDKPGFEDQIGHDAFVLNQKQAEAMKPYLDILKEKLDTWKD